MFCGQIHAPATLPNYVYKHFTNSKFLASLYSSKHRLFCFFAKQLTPYVSFPSEETFGLLRCSFVAVNKFQCETSFTLPSVAVTGSLFICDGVLCVRIFLLCNPLRRTTVAGHIIILKGQSTNCMYMTKWILYIVSNAYVTFQFSFCSIPRGCFEK
jgi:hypothetical protein